MLSSRDGAQPTMNDDARAQFRAIIAGTQADVVYGRRRIIAHQRRKLEGADFLIGETSHKERHVRDWAKCRAHGANDS